MDNLLRICSLDQLADDTEMQDYLRCPAGAANEAQTGHQHDRRHSR